VSEVRFTTRMTISVYRKGVGYVDDTLDEGFAYACDAVRDLAGHWRRGGPEGHIVTADGTCIDVEDLVTRVDDNEIEHDELHAELAKRGADCQHDAVAVRERDRARATAVDLEQRLAEVERYVQLNIELVDRYKTAEGVFRGTLVEILAIINADHGGDEHGRPGLPACVDC